MEQHTVRKATLSDAKYISLLAKITFFENFGKLFYDKEQLELYLDKKFSKTVIKASLQKEENHYWLAYANGLPVGFAKLKKDSPLPNSDCANASQLQEITILKEYRLHAEGKLLKHSLFEEIQNFVSNRVWLSVLHTDQKAIEFYRNLNFHKYDSYSFTIGSEDFTFNIMLQS